MSFSVAGFYFVVVMIPVAIYVVPGLVVFLIIAVADKNMDLAEMWIGFWFRPVILIGESLGRKLLRAAFEREFKVTRKNPATQDGIEAHLCLLAVLFRDACRSEQLILSERPSHGGASTMSLWRGQRKRAQSRVKKLKGAFWSARRLAMLQGFSVLDTVGEYQAIASRHHECRGYLHHPA